MAAPVIAVSATILAVVAVRRGLLPAAFVFLAYWGGCLGSVCVPAVAMMFSRDPVWLRLLGAALAGVAGLVLWWFSLTLGVMFV